MESVTMALDDVGDITEIIATVTIRSDGTAVIGGDNVARDREIIVEALRHALAQAQRWSDH